MRLSAAGRGALLALAVVVFVTTWPTTPAYSITKAQVEQACADSKAQYEAYLQARADFESAVQAWEDTVYELAVVEEKQNRASSVATQQVGSVEEVRRQLEEQAIELYMQGGFGSPGLMFMADSVDDLITGEAFLSASSGDDLASLDQLISLQADLNRYQGDLDDTQSSLESLERAQSEANDRLEAAAAAEREAASRLDTQCAELNKQYEVEQAAKRAAEEEARRRAAAAAASSSSSSGGSSASRPSAPSRISVVSGLACPFPGSSFRDTWGAPRSGGRRHKGVDMFGPWNGGIYAVDNGTVYIRNGGLGGKTVWLVSGSGAYYYAHLSDWAVSNGQTVSRGQLIGYNGDTGNARGGSPHLHFEVHPGGRGSAAINPTPTVRASC